MNPYVKIERANLKESDDEEFEKDEPVDPLANLKDLIGSDESEDEKKTKKRAVRLSSGSE